MVETMYERIEADALEDILPKICGIIGSDNFSSGERAALRRLNLNDTPGIVFYRFWPKYLGREAPDEKVQYDWAAILTGIAIMGKNAHDKGCGFGASLANAGYSEERLERFLGSDPGEPRRIGLIRAIRFLASNGERVNWVEIAAWLLSCGDKHETISRRIVQRYYAQKVKKSK